MSLKQKAILEKSVMVFAVIVLVFLCVLMPLIAGAQAVDPPPQPTDEITCVTPTPTGSEWCMSPPVAIAATPTPTPVAPTVASTLDPFVPTATTQPTPTNTRRPTFTPTSIVISPLPTQTPKAHLPIARVP